MPQRETPGPFDRIRLTRSDGRVVLAGASFALDWRPVGDKRRPRRWSTGHFRPVDRSPDTGGDMVDRGQRHRAPDRTAGTLTKAGAATPETSVWEATETGGLTVTWVVERQDGQLRIECTVSNGSNAQVRLEAATIGFTHLALGTGPASWSMWRNGTQSWSGTRSAPIEVPDPDLPPLVRRTTTDPRHRLPSRSGTARSAGLTAITSRSTGDVLGAGALNASEAFHYVDVTTVQGKFARFELCTDLDGIELPVGASRVVAQWLLVTDCSGNPSAATTVLERLADAVGGAAGARIGRPVNTGWCSWYHYFQHVTAADIGKNLSCLPTATEPVALDYFMVDDGHQSEIGDWRHRSPNFADGMRVVAEQILQHSMRPGIWLAPFLAAKRSHLARNHPNWLLSPGKVPTVALVNPAWGAQRIFALDTTHPEVLEWLETLAREIVWEWGFDVLKLDFLFAGALPGKRFRQDVTRAEALRLGLDAIRRGAGPDAVLIGCGCPLGPAIGAVDVMRIGADVEPRWTTFRARTAQRDLHGISTRHALRNILTRSFMDGRFWTNDPDCLTLRSVETELTDDERFTIATLMGLSNGLLIVSDDLTTWTDVQRDLLEWAMTLRGGQIFIPDLGSADLPQQVWSRFDDHVLVAQCNLSASPRRFAVDVGRYWEGTADASGVEPWEAVADARSGARLSAAGGIVDLGYIAPHGTRVIRIDR
jgi:alpha-galactosidase